MKSPFSTMFSTVFKSPSSAMKRALSLTTLKYILMAAIFGAFVFNLVLVYTGSAVIDDYLTDFKSTQELLSLKRVFKVFVYLNLAFATIGFVSISSENTNGSFVFTIYMIYVCFGTFFDTITKNHLASLGVALIAILSLIFSVSLRMEKINQLRVIHNTVKFNMEQTS
ncbi:hypothetical protein HDE_03935 [Halotydeus destructor]|nr:hypothetical protein HDE_03935 [Halotydeus destructor]